MAFDMLMTKEDLEYEEKSFNRRWDTTELERRRNWWAMAILDAGQELVKRLNKQTIRYLEDARISYNNHTIHIKEKDEGPSYRVCLGRLENYKTKEIVYYAHFCDGNGKILVHGEIHSRPHNCQDMPQQGLWLRDAVKGQFGDLVVQYFNNQDLKG